MKFNFLFKEEKWETISTKSANNVKKLRWGTVNSADNVTNGVGTIYIAAISAVTGLAILKFIL